MQGAFKIWLLGFRSEILEYCPSSIVLAREQFYLDKFKPEYNILKIAGSPLRSKLPFFCLPPPGRKTKGRRERGGAVGFFY